MPYSIGIDVSHWQGDIDWKLVAQDGIDFVYAKASEGTAITDAMFAEHPLWAANYTTANEPLLPTPWKSWTVWQHTSKAVVWGIKGGVDRNRAKPGFVNDGGEVPRFVELTVNEKSALDLKAALDAGLT